MRCLPSLRLILMVAVCVSGVEDAEAFESRDEAEQAIQLLAKQDNYTWTSVRKNAGEDAESVHGKIRQDGLALVTLNMAGRSVEGVLKGRKGALKVDGSWMSTKKFKGGGGSPSSNPMTFLARHLSVFAKSPAVQASGLLNQTQELQSDGKGVYSGKLSDEGVKKNVPRFGVKVTNPEGSVKFWVKDGMLVKYTYSVRANVEFLRQQRQTNYDRTTTVEIKDAGTTKLDVSEDALKSIE